MGGGVGLVGVGARVLMIDSDAACVAACACRRLRKFPVDIGASLSVAMKSASRPSSFLKKSLIRQKLVRLSYENLNLHVIVLQQFLFPFDVFAFVDDVHYNVVKLAVVKAAILLGPT